MQALASFTVEGRASEFKDKVSSRSGSLFEEFSIFKAEGTLPRSEVALNTNRRFPNLDKLESLRARAVSSSPPKGVQVAKCALRLPKESIY